MEAAEAPTTNNFRRTKLTQQTIYHWKGNVMESRIHFKYWKNILISRFDVRLLQNDSAMAPEKIFELLKF